MRLQIPTWEPNTDVTYRRGTATPGIESACLHKYLQHPEIGFEYKLLIAAYFEFPHRSVASSR